MTTDLYTIFGAFVVICFSMWLLIVWAIAGVARPTASRRRVQR